MKRKFLNLAMTAAIFVSILVTGCGSSSLTATAKKNTIGMIPCSTYNTDDDFFRAQGVGYGRHITTARVKAHMDANAKLANTILAWIKDFCVQYLTDIGQDPGDYIHIFEMVSKQRIEEQIGNATDICNKTDKGNDNMHYVYMAIELSRKKVFETFNQAFATESQLEGIYDQEKFIELYKNQSKL